MNLNQNTSSGGRAGNGKKPTSASAKMRSLLGNDKNKHKKNDDIESGGAAGQGFMERNY